VCQRGGDGLGHGRREPGLGDEHLDAEAHGPYESLTISLICMTGWIDV
jgi:hypothetical protein